MMPILVKDDDVRSGTKAKACHDQSQAAQNSIGQTLRCKTTAGLVPPNNKIPPNLFMHLGGE